MSQSYSRAKVILDIVTLAVAVGAAVFAGLAWHTAQNQLVAGQRAWIAPGGIVFEGVFTRGNVGIVRLGYANLGHEPATNIGRSTEPILIPIGEIHDEAAVRRHIRDAIGGVACQDAKPAYPGAVMFPAGGSQEGVRVEVKEAMVADVLDKKSYLAIVGCFAYRTAGKVAHSEFCRFFDYVGAAPVHLKSSKCFIAEYVD